MWKRLGSNATANLSIGVSTMAFQLGATAIASRSFDGPSFGAWTLAISLAALTPLFAMNLASVVARQSMSAVTSASGHAVAVVARRAAQALAMFALAFTLIAAVLLHANSTALSRIGPVAFAALALVLACGQIWQITLQPAFGQSLASERNWPIALVHASARGAALLAMWAACALFSGTLIAVALAVAIAQWAAVAMAPAVRGTALDAPAPGHVELAELSRQSHETRRLLKGFALWSIGAAAIQYGLPPLVSLFDSARYNDFYLAYTLNGIVSGAVGAAGAALLAPMTRLRLAERNTELLRWLKYMPVAGAVCVLAALTLIWVCLAPVLAHWAPRIGSHDAVASYLHLLGFQTLARSTAIVFAIALSSGASPRELVRPTVTELVLVVCVAMPLGVAFGETFLLAGIAFAGAIASIVACHGAATVAALDRPQRAGLLGVFITTQIATLAIWHAVTRA